MIAIRPGVKKTGPRLAIVATQEEDLHDPTASIRLAGAVVGFTRLVPSASSVYNPLLPDSKTTVWPPFGLRSFFIELKERDDATKRLQVENFHTGNSVS